MSGHSIHVGTMVGPALLLALWAAWADLRVWLRSREGKQLPTAAAVAALLSGVAGAIHLMVLSPHLSESALYGAFFGALAAMQLGWAVLVLLRPRPWLLSVGVVANLAVVALWVQTRTAGIPVGVAAGRREPIGVLDAGGTLLELGIVACCALVHWTREPAAAHA